MRGNRSLSAGESGRAAERRFLLALLAVYLLFLAFNAMTPMAGDDYAHYFGISGEHVDTPREIGENLQDLWLHSNGRVAAHLMVYLVQIPPRPLFWLLNAAVPPLVLWLMLRMLPEKQRNSPGLLLTAGMLLWLFTPAFGEVFLWLTGSCNYGWSLPLELAVLTPILRAALGEREEAGVGRTLLLLAGAFLSGFYSEIGALALLSTAFLLLVMTALREKRVPLRLALAFLFGCAGFALLLTAPSTLPSRTGGGFSLLRIAGGLKAVILALREYFLPLYLLYALLFALVWVRGGSRRTLAASLLLVLGALAPAVALSTAAYLVSRSFTMTGLFTVLACLLLLGELAGKGEMGARPAVAAVLAVLFAFSFLTGAGDIVSLFFQSREREAVIRAARESGETEVTLRAYVTSTAYSEIRDEGLAASPDYWYNQELAQYYGFEKVYGILPEEENR